MQKKHSWAYSCCSSLPITQCHTHASNLGRIPVLFLYIKLLPLHQSLIWVLLQLKPVWFSLYWYSFLRTWSSHLVLNCFFNVTYLPLPLYLPPSLHPPLPLSLSLSHVMCSCHQPSCYSSDMPSPSLHWSLYPSISLCPEMYVNQYLLINSFLLFRSQFKFHLLIETSLTIQYKVTAQSLIKLPYFNFLLTHPTIWYFSFIKLSVSLH